MNINEVKKGPENLARKLNEIIDRLNQLSSITGDGVIKVSRTNNGFAVSIDPKMLAPKLAKIGGGGGGEAAIYGEIVRGLLEADPARPPEEGPTEGYSQYIVRLEDDTTPYWNSQTIYDLNAEVIGSNERKYKSKIPYNQGNNPVQDTEENYWAMQAELAPKSLAQSPHNNDMRTVWPQFQVGDTPEIFQKDEVWYFKGAFIRVRSSGGVQSLKYKDDRAAAVFGG